MLEIEEQEGPFIPGPRAGAGPTGHGPLDGLTFAAKDVFDVAGTLTTYGNPDWARTHPPAVAHAPAVQALLEAGASLIGKTKTVELAWGITGENPWHGTPRNPRARDRLPGGSSAGSAVAVAGGQADFALGTDTGGSVRVPASYCGLFGIRPTHGAVSVAGVCPLAPSLDTVGWFARSATLLARVGDALLPGGHRSGLGGPILMIEEAWVNAQPAAAEGLRPAVERLERLCGRALALRLVPEGLDVIYDHFRAIQAQEVWATLGGWVTSVRPRLSAAVADRMDAAANLDPAVAADGRAFRRCLQARIRPLLEGGAVLVAPTSPCVAPIATATPAELEIVRQSTMGVTTLASLCGLPEVTLPATSVRSGRDSLPVGLSLIAAPGRDRALLALAVECAAVLGIEG